MYIVIYIFLCPIYTYCKNDYRKCILTQNMYYFKHLIVTFCIIYKVQFMGRYVIALLRTTLDRTVSHFICQRFPW